jgi:hypothetical protein
MKPDEKKTEAVSEFLILPDGRLMVHNLTPTMAAVVSELDPEDGTMRKRCGNRVEITRKNATVNRD